MASPRISYPDSSVITWSNGDLFNGFALIGIALPTSSGTAFLGVRYGNSGISEAVPQWYKVPVRDGVLHSSSGLLYNADLTPPASIYYGWFYTSNGPTAGGPSRMIAGPSASFSVTAPTFAIPALTLPVPSAGSVPVPDTSVSASSTPATATFTLVSPAETADGVETEFTFSGLPQVVIYNGQWRFEGVGYERTGFVISLLDDAGDVFAPETGASLKAIL
jgi:hypothetical protein